MPPVKIVAKCRIVTPMLSSGADQCAFELRASEVKAGLRFWWRAFQPLDGKELFEKEAGLFGSTSGGCPFNLVVVPYGEPISVWEPGKSVEDAPPKWGRGLGYVFFSIYSPPGFQRKAGRNVKVRDASIKPAALDQRKSGRSVARPGGEFHIRMTFPNVSSMGTQVGDVLCSLWLLENLGGLGGRTRRAAGCFEITELTGNGQPVSGIVEDAALRELIGEVPGFDTEKGQTPLSFVEEGVKVILRRWKTTAREGNSSPAYTAYCHGKSRIIVAWPDSAGSQDRFKATSMMDMIGAVMQDFRKKSPHDEAAAMHESLDEAIRNSGSRGSPPVFPKGTITKACMGMPIIYNFRDGGRMLKIPGSNKNATYELKGGVLNKEGTREPGAERRASPVMISCHERGGKPYAVICHFPAELLPPGQQLLLQANYADPRIGDLYPIPNDTEFADLFLKNIQDTFHTHVLLDQIGPSVKKTPQRVPVAADQKSTTTADKTGGKPLDESNAQVSITEQILGYLSRVPEQYKELRWYVGEIIGPATGVGKKRQWPCRLWYREEAELRQDPQDWFLRADKLGSALGLRTELGSLFLCTKQADRTTPPHGKYLYNIRRLST